MNVLVFFLLGIAVIVVVVGDFNGRLGRITTTILEIAAQEASQLGRGHIPKDGWHWLMIVMIERRMVVVGKHQCRAILIIIATQGQPERPDAVWLLLLQRLENGIEHAAGFRALRAMRDGNFLLLGLLGALLLLLQGLFFLRQG